MSVAEVEKWAGAGSGAVPRPEASVPGYDVFLVRLASAGRDADFFVGAAVSTATHKVVPGRDALAEALTRWKPTPSQLALAAAILVDKGSEPLLAPPSGIDVDRTAPQERALAAAPLVADNTLVYWSYLRAGGPPGLVRSKVDLTTLDVTRMPALNIIANAVPEADRIPALIASASVFDRQQAIEILQAHCDDAAMRPTMEAALRSTSATTETRRALVELAERCRALASIDALGGVLAHDPDSSVRLTAVGVLARSLDRAALPFLDAAANGDADREVRDSAAAGAAGLRRRVP